MTTAPRRIVRPTAKPSIETSTALKSIAKISTSVQNNINKDKLNETEKQIDLRERKFSESNPPAHVRFNVGQTYNLGDFNSLRLDVSVTMPCLPEEIEETFSTIASRAADFLSAEEQHWLPANGQ